MKFKDQVSNYYSMNPEVMKQGYNTAFKGGIASTKKGFFEEKDYYTIKTKAD